MAEVNKHHHPTLGGFDFHVGDEWTDGQFNYIIVKVEDVLNVDETAVIRYVTVFDGEGVVDRLPAMLHLECVVEEGWTPVTEPSLDKRLKEWREAFPAGDRVDRYCGEPFPI